MISCAGFAALLGRLPVSGSVEEAFLICATVCGLGLFGFYGKATLRAAAKGVRALRSRQPASPGPALQEAGA